MYHEATKNGQYFRGFYPLKKLFFPTPGSSSSFTKIANYAGVSAKVLRKLRLCGSLISFTPTANSTNKYQKYKSVELGDQLMIYCRKEDFFFYHTVIANTKRKRKTKTRTQDTRMCIQA